MKARTLTTGVSRRLEASKRAYLRGGILAHSRDDPRLGRASIDVIKIGRWIQRNRENCNLAMV
jgi:hypothetical protein